MRRPKGFLAQARCQLTEARESRVHPERDDKVLTLTSSNGLMLAAFPGAAQVLEEVLALGAPSTQLSTSRYGKGLSNPFN